MFGRLFGRKKDGGTPPAGGKVVLPPGVPSELADAVRLVLGYWSHDRAEQAALQEQGVHALGWPDLLRLHHLNCLEALADGPLRKELEDDGETIAAPDPEPVAALTRCRETADRLLGADSPFRPRFADVWQGERDEPTFSGELANPSLTHLGSLEVLRLDGQNRPREVGFVAFDDLRAVAFGPPGLFRAARLLYDDGRPDEIVFVPLLYATSWRSNSPYLREGRMTQFFGYPPGDGLAARFGIGVGQQDFSVEEDGGQSLFGHGSVVQIAFALDTADPRFDLKCRTRGLGPDTVRREMRPGGGGGA